MTNQISTNPGFLGEQFNLITDYWSTHTPAEGYAEFAEETSELVKAAVSGEGSYVQSSAGSALGVTLLAGSIGAGLFEWGNRVVRAKFAGEIPAVELVRFPIEGIIGGAMSVYETGRKWLNEGIPENNYDASYEVTSTLGTAVLLAGGAKALIKGAGSLPGLLTDTSGLDAATGTAQVNRGGMVIDLVEGPDGVFRPARQNPELSAIARSDYQVQSSPAGLQVILTGGANIAQTALQVLNDSAGTTIPNNRIVLSAQGWEISPVITASLTRALQAMAEDSGFTICLKTSLPDHLATEFIPAVEVARQQAAGPMAAAKKSGQEPDRVLVRAGTYRIGVDTPDSFYNPSRRVTLTQPFGITSHLITNADRQALYQELAGRGDTHALMSTANTGRRFALVFGSEADLVSRKVPGDMPVELVRVVPDPDILLRAIPENQRRPRQPAVSWLYDELVAYANAIGRRLPTAAEWEVAARTAEGEDGRLFDYSTQNGFLWNTPDGRFVVGAQKMADFGGEPPLDVGSFPPNRRGIYDMTGAVWEYLDTFWDKVDIDDLIDPTGSNTSWSRSVRGGSSLYNDKDKDYLHAGRDYRRYEQGERLKGIGGRPVWRRTQNRLLP